MLKSDYGKLLKCRKQYIDMKKRQENKKNRNKKEKPIKDDSTFSTPKIVAEPKTEKEKKDKIRHVNREKNELFLEERYLDSIQKLSSFDLGIINNADYYPENKKKDRHYNRGIQRAKDDLELLNFLLINLKPHYKHQIFSSNEFQEMIQSYLGIGYFSDKSTWEEKDQVLALASQMLIYSLTILKNNMPPEFNELLKQSGKPFFDLIEAITKFSKVHNIKKVPDIQIPDSLM